jgi:hypothetical protein
MPHPRYQHSADFILKYNLIVVMGGRNECQRSHHYKNKLNQKTKYSFDIPNQPSSNSFSNKNERLVYSDLAVLNLDNLNWISKIK